MAKAKKKATSRIKAGQVFTRPAGLFGTEYRRVLEVRPNRKKKNEDQAVVLSWRAGGRGRSYAKDDPEGKYKGGGIKIVPMDEIEDYLSEYEKKS